MSYSENDGIIDFNPNNSNNSIWVRRDIYRETTSRLRSLDEKFRTEQANLTSAQNRLSSLSGSLDSEIGKKVDSRFREESRRQNNAIGELEESIQLQLGRANLAIAQQIDDVRLHAGRIEEDLEQTNANVDRLRTEVESMFSQISSRLSSEKERAEVYLEELQLLLGKINQLHPDKLAPGEAETIINTIAMAESDIKEGDYQAALSVSQNRIPSATALQAHLEILNDEFARLVQRLNNDIGKFKELIERYGTPEANKVILDGEAKPGQEPDKISFDGRIDFWSSDLLTEIATHYNEISARACDEYLDAMNIELLRSACESLERIDAELESCVSIAHNEYVEYYYMIELANRLLGAMKQGAWNWCSDGFENDDLRNPFHAVFDDGAGNEASIVVFHERPIREQTRRRVLHGGTKFAVNVVHPGDEQQGSLCEQTRTSLLQRFEASGIDVAADMRTPGSNNPDISSERFALERSNAGSTAKRRRIEALRTQYGLNWED